ncbi:MAG: T9SS type A sorting domain-containing protein, partial [Ignavibacteriales bacterium]|nr:T9SS type A sorting domain-containing protein [Ignavibacteriales bacterium]
EGKSTYTAHIIYLEDLQAGASVFGGADGTPTLNNVVYKTFSFQATDVKDNDAVVTSYQLSQNYPNPFNPTTQIQYTIPERGNVSIKVYDVLGNEVATLFNGMQESGSHSVNFDASKLSSGMYLYTINAGSFTASKKMMLMK